MPDPRLLLCAGLSEGFFASPQEKGGAACAYAPEAQLGGWPSAWPFLFPPRSLPAHALSSATNSWAALWPLAQGSPGMENKHAAATTSCP